MTLLRRFAWIWCAIPFLASAGVARLRVETRPVGSFLAVSDELIGQVRFEGQTLVAERVGIRLDDFRTGIPLRDRLMREKYFETGKFPNAVVKNASGLNGEFSGTLVLHGVERPIAGHYEVSGFRCEISFTVKISDFGIPIPEYMGVFVRDEIRVDAELPVLSAGAP